jgi:soluble lytic murein transglycosylase
MSVDRDGTLHFTNMPVARKGRFYFKEQKTSLPSLYSQTRYDNYIKKAAKKHKISFALVKAMIKAESDFCLKAVSKAGAMGLMQIMPNNFKSLKINDPFDPMENINGGTYYIKYLLKKFKGDLSLALAAYNAGPKAVLKYKSIPPFSETKQFVKRVMKYYYTYKKTEKIL